MCNLPPRTRLRGVPRDSSVCIMHRASRSRLYPSQAQVSRMGMLECFLPYKSMNLIKVPARDTSRRCAECGYVDKDNIAPGEG